MGGPHGAPCAGEIYDLIKANKTSLMFVNTRAQAEMRFRISGVSTTTGLLCASSLSLDVRSVARSRMRWRQESSAAWSASSLDLGIDWATSIWSSMSVRRRARHG